MNTFKKNTPAFLNVDLISLISILYQKELGYNGSTDKSDTDIIWRRSSPFSSVGRKSREKLRRTRS